jgi:hypothetical protein
MNAKIAKLIDIFIETKMKESVNYIKELKKKSKTLDYEKYLMYCFVSYPQHKWHLDLKKEYIDAYKKVYLYVKLNFRKLSRIKNFEELLVFLDNMDVKYFGELSVYDVALCIGLMFDILPKKVYSHAGPRNSLKYILGSQYSQKVKKLNNNQIEYIEVKDMPKEFTKLADTPYLIEDCLCFIWSEYLKKQQKITP